MIVRSRHATARPRQRGIALVLALWITVMLTVIGTGFAFSMRGEAMATRNALSAAMARAAADGAIDRTVFELMRPRTMADTWQADGQFRRWSDGEAIITAVALDESAKIDLNSAREPLLRGLLHQVGGLAQEEAQAVAEAILDWRDPDDLRRPNGAEESDYRAAGRDYRPSNGMFESVGELRRVLGITGALYERISGTLTVYSRQAGINPTTATRDVLLAVPNVTPEQVDTYIQTRSDALAAKLPVPPFPIAQGVMSNATSVWRIRAEATMPDGVMFVREAVVRPDTDPRRRYVTFLWQESARAMPPATPDPAAAQSSDGILGRR